MKLKHLLLLDPHDDVRETLTYLFEHYGYQVKACKSAKEALTIAPTLLPGPVVMELALPDMTGAGLCRELRGFPHMRNCKFIALTGNSLLFEKAEKNCFDAVLLKPLDIDKILGILES